MIAKTFEIKPGLEGANTLGARLARFAFRFGEQHIDRCYAVTITDIEDPGEDEESTEAQIEDWFHECGIDAVVMELFGEIYFAREDDRTLFLLRWVGSNDSILHS